MVEKSPREILNDFKEGKCVKSAAIESLFSVFQNADDLDDDTKIQVVEMLIKHFLVDAEGALKWIITNEVSPNCLFELYQFLEVEGERAEELRKFMELTIGKDFLKKYNLIPKEALALELIGRGLVWRHPIYHTDPKNWNLTPPQLTDLYDHKAENGVVFQIWICYPFNKIESKYFKLLSGLGKLYLHDCRITDYSFLTHLTCLTVSGGDVPQISEMDEIKGLENLLNLEELDLSYNEISEIKNLERLVKLKKLDLSKNCINEIKGLQYLSQLEDLNLEFNNICEIKGLETLLNLKVLNLADNRNIIEIEGLEKLLKLESLDLGNNYLINEIKGLNTLIKLKDLNLSRDHYLELDQYEEIKIKGLNAAQNNFISEMNDFIKKENQYKAKIAQTTKYITKIRGLENLVNLEELYLSGNHISKIDGINHLRKLRILDLSHNQISELHDIDNLNGLEELYVSDTQISEEKLEKLKKKNQFLKIKN